MDEFCNIFLTFFEFVWLFLLAVFVILEERHDKIKKLFHDFLRIQELAILDDSFDNPQRNYSAIAKFHVLHEGEIIVHIKDCNRQRIKWNREELDEKTHGDSIGVCERSGS